MDAFEEPRGINPLAGETLLSRYFLTTREKRGGRRGNGGNSADRRRAVSLALPGLVSGAAVLTMFFATSSSFAEALEPFFNSEVHPQNQHSGELQCRRVSPDSDFLRRNLDAMDNIADDGRRLPQFKNFVSDFYYSSSDYVFNVHKLTHFPTEATVYHFIDSSLGRAAGVYTLYYTLSVCLRTPALDDRGLPQIVQSLVTGGSDVLDSMGHEQCARVGLKSSITRDFTCYYSDFDKGHDTEDALSRLLYTVFVSSNFNEKNFLSRAWRYHATLVDEKPFYINPHDERAKYRFEFEGAAYSEAHFRSSHVDCAITEAAIKRLLSDTTFANSPIGTPKEIPQSTLVDALKYYEAHYRLDNAAIIVSPGEIEDRQLEAVQKVLISVPRRSKVGRAQPATTATYQGKQETPSELTTLNIPTWKDTTRESLYILWLMDPVQDMQNPKKSLLSNKARFYLMVVQQLLLTEFSEAGLSVTLAQPTSNTSIPQTISGFNVKDSQLGAKKADELVMKTMKNIVANGFSKGVVEDVLLFLESKNKQHTFIRDLFEFSKILVSAHFAGREPLIHTGALFAEVRAALKKGNGRLFEEYIDRFFVSNPFRLAIWANTSEEQRNLEFDETRKRLETLKMNMSFQQFGRIVSPNIPALRPKMAYSKLQSERKIGEARIFKLLLDVKDLAFFDFAISVDNLSVSEIRLLNVLINLMYKLQDEQRGDGKSTDSLFKRPSAPSAARIKFDTVRKVFLDQPIKQSEVYKSKGFLFFHSSAKPSEAGLVAEQFSMIVEHLKVEDQNDCLWAVDALMAQIRYEMSYNGDVLIRSVGKGLTDESMALKVETMGAPALKPLQEFREVIESDWAKAQSTLRTLRDRLIKTKTISVIVSSSYSGLEIIFSKALDYWLLDKLRSQQAMAVESANTEYPVWAQEIRQKGLGMFGNRSVGLQAPVEKTAISLQFPLFRDGVVVNGIHIVASAVFLKYYPWWKIGGARIPFFFDPFSGRVHITIWNAHPTILVDHVLHPLVDAAEIAEEILPGRISDSHFKEFKGYVAEMLENQVFPKPGTSGVARIQQADLKSVEIAFRKVKQDIMTTSKYYLKYFFRQLRLSLQSMPEKMWFAYLFQGNEVKFEIIDKPILGS